MAVAQMAANGCNQPGRYRWPPEPVQGCRRFDVLPAICPDLAPPKRYYTPHGRNTYSQYKPLHQPKSPPGASCPPAVALYLYLLAQEPPVAELQRQLKGRFSKQPGGLSTLPTGNYQLDAAIGTYLLFFHYKALSGSAI